MGKPEKIRCALRINNEDYDLFISPHRTLLEVLRDELQLTGAKESCNEGACGTCTVLLDGLPVRSCLLLALEAQGREVTTIEGLAKDGKLHPVQEAFVEHHGIQCGFCSPGMILTAFGLLAKNPKPTREQIIRGMEQNLCRCGAHTRIIDAIETAAAEMKGGR